MAVAPGTLLGAYDVLALLGSGGMGEVYRARDTRLDRLVAIKVLPASVAHDPDRRQRLDREARAISSLNHPHICTLHDVGHQDGIDYLVMELLEGQTLAERLTKGALPLDQAVQYAIQLADALDVAHRRGIVHRDLKPANVFLARSGSSGTTITKLLDFGIAKAVALPPAATAAATLTSDGTLLGTLQYMAPEQLEGRDADTRSDLFAFGAVLYEMLTGRRAFPGESQASVIAAVLDSEPPPLSTSQSLTPPALEHLVKTCLAKNPDERWQTAGDVKRQLEWIAASGSAQSTRVEQAKTGRRWLPWIAAGAFAVGLALVLLGEAPWRTTAPPQSLRLTAELGAGAWLSPVPLPFGSAFAISSDGTVVAFVGQQNDRDAARIYVRRLNELQPTPLAGTDGPTVRAPFFSPDGRWLGFYRNGKLMKISVNGGGSTAVADAPQMTGTWSADGTIVFSPNLSSGTTLWRASPDGGNAELLTSLVEGEQVHAWPQILPGGKAVLYTSSNVVGAFNDAQIVVQPLPTGPRKVVHRGGFHGRYLRSGHLVYIHDGTLFAASFDLDRLELLSEPVPVLQGVASSATSGGAQFSVSDNGTLVYLPGRTEGLGRSLQFMDRDGKTTPLRAAPMNWFNLVFARDGGRLAMEIRGESSDIWVYELARDALTRLTSSPAEDTRPVWTPDDHRIVFASTRGGTSAMNLYWQRADGTGEAERLTESANDQRANSFHRSGRFLAFDETDLTRYRVMILPMNGDDASGWMPGTPRAFLDTPFFEADPVFSPDGRWIAYTSNESGLVEVHVAPFPGPGPRVQISSGGAGTPTWSRTKQELFFDANGRIMVAAYTVAGDTFRAEQPRLWSERFHEGNMTSRAIGLHPDGKRFVLSPATRARDDAKTDRVVLISNFFDELRRVAPVAGR